MTTAYEQSTLNQLRSVEQAYNELLRQHAHTEAKYEKMRDNNKAYQQKVVHLNARIDTLQKATFNESERQAMLLEIDKLRMENRRLSKVETKYKKMKAVFGED